MEICFHSTWPHLAEEMSVWRGGGRNCSIFGFHWKNQRTCSSKREKCPHFDCQGNVACALILCRRSIVRQRAPSIQTAMQCGYCCCVAQYLLPLHLKKMSEIEWKATSFPPQTMSSECWFFSRIFAWWIHLFCLSVERQHFKKKSEHQLQGGAEQTTADVGVACGFIGSDLAQTSCHGDQLQAAALRPSKILAADFRAPLKKKNSSIKNTNESPKTISVHRVRR